MEHIQEQVLPGICRELGEWKEDRIGKIAYRLSQAYVWLWSGESLYVATRTGWGSKVLQGI